MIEQAEATALLEESPELQRFNNRLKTIEKLKADAATEQDLVLMKDSYETILRMQERLYTEILTYISEEHSKQFQAAVEVCNKRMGMIQELEGMLKKAYALDAMGMDAPIKQTNRSHLKLIKKEGR